MNAPCDVDGYDGVHAFLSTGLDDLPVRMLSPRPAGYRGDVLCTTRRCVRCGTEQAKPYGAGGQKRWRTVTGIKVEQ